MNYGKPGIPETADEVPETGREPQTADELPETSDGAAQTADELPETSDGAAQTADELPETSDGAAQTADELPEMPGRHQSPSGSVKKQTVRHMGDGQKERAGNPDRNERKAVFKGILPYLTLLLVMLLLTQGIVLVLRGQITARYQNMQETYGEYYDGER